MGKQDGGGPALGRRARQLAPVAALAGAAAAAAAATYRRRRHQASISPERSLAGPPVQRDAPQVATLVAQLSSALEPSSDAALVPAAQPTVDRPPLVRRGAEVADPGAGSVGEAETAAAAAVATAAPVLPAPALPARLRPSVRPPSDGEPEPDDEPTAAPTAPAAAPTPPPADAARTSNGASTAAIAPASPPIDTPADAAAGANGASTASAPIAAPAAGAPADALPEPVRSTDRPPAPVPPPAYAAPLAAEPPPAPEATPVATGTAGASEPDGDRPARPGFAARQVAALRRHRVRLVAGLVVVALGVAASAAIAGVEEEPDSATTAETSDAGDDTRDPASTPETSRPSETVGSTDPQLEPSEVFGEAATQLVVAGSFRYQGVVRATDVSTSRPMMWLTVETAVRGEVDLPTRRVHEIAEAEDGRTSETIVDGTDVWGRRADTATEAAGVPYALVPELSRPDGPGVRGLAGLPAWLSGAVGAVELDPAPDGRRFQATVPGAVFGPVERDRQAEDVVVVVTVDDEALPRRIELATAASDHLRLGIELTAHGARVEIVPPAPADT